MISLYSAGLTVIILVLLYLMGCVLLKLLEDLAKH